MDLCNAMKRWRPLWGTHYSARYNFCLAASFSTAMGTGSFLYTPLE